MRPSKNGSLDTAGRSRALLQKWADGKATLKDVRGYTSEQLYAMARTAYFYYHQGLVDEARTLFEGLYAIDPLDPYFARALGVVEFSSGNPSGAIAAYDVAIRLAPEDPAGYVGRAEVRLSQGQTAQAVADLERAASLAAPRDPQKRKVSGLLKILRRK